MRTLSAVALAAAPIALATAVMTAPPTPVPVLACAAAAPIASGAELAKFTSSLFGSATAPRHKRYLAHERGSGSEDGESGRSLEAGTNPIRFTAFHFEWSCL